MPYFGYFALGGNEFINTTRAATYAANLAITTVQCGACPDLARAVGELPYVSPADDDAPWFDPIVADSKDFAGLVGLEITGLSKTFGHREPVPLTTDGSSLHPFRRTHREIQIRALALAKTDCALSYGFSWLASVLRGGCNQGCVGDNLCFFTCCPTCEDPPEPPEPDPCMDQTTQHWRQLFNVGLLDMAEPTNVRKVPGGWIGEITITLAAGDPFIYSEPAPVTGPTTSRYIPDYDPNVSTNCTEDIDCLRDPDCPTPPAPILPPPPKDMCFPTGIFDAAQAIIELPPNSTPVWAEKVPYIEIRAGSRRMERITVRWYLNPLGSGCANPDPCLACAEINIAFIPADSTLTIDGRTETASVDCPGGPGLATAEPNLYGRAGGPFVWPIFRCADAMCVEVIAEATTLAEDASIEIFSVVREDAA